MLGLNEFDELTANESFIVVYSWISGRRTTCDGEGDSGIQVALSLEFKGDFVVDFRTIPYSGDHDDS